MSRLKTKLKILKYANLTDTQMQIAAKTGLTQKTVSKVLNEEEFKELRRAQRQELVEMTNKEAKAILQNELSQLRSRTKTEAATAFGITVDKMRALAGEDYKEGSLQFADNRQITFKVSPNLAKVIRTINPNAKIEETK